MLILLCSFLVPPPADAPLKVRAAVPRGPHFVGQAIDLQVVTVAEGGEPQVVPPRIDQSALTIAPIETKVRPVASNGIGDVVNETSQYTFRYRLMASRAGRFTIPPFVVRKADRSGRSQALEVEIKTPPLAGRPASFLGGVGALQLDAQVEPPAVRVGQEFEFRIRLEGPGARGSVRRPDLEAIARSPLGIRVEDLPEQYVADPPLRVLRYRLRPSRAGEGRLPAVAVSTFDPKTGLYQTRATPAVSIRAVDVPQFDPRQLDDYEPPQPRALLSETLANGLIVGLALLLACAWAVLRLARGHPHPGRDPARLARRLAHNLKPARDPCETAERVSDAIIEYLYITSGRPRGAITPDEARGSIAEQTASDELAERSAQLIGLCDQARFAASEASGADLVDLGKCLLLELSAALAHRKNATRGTHDRL
jgi:hypothetical protein